MNSDSTGKVLVIDDDAEIRYSLQRVLSSRSFAVDTASSGEEGILVAEKAAYEVIFVDNRMEGMGGLEALQHLRSVSPNSMVVLMTAFGTTQTAIEAMKYGAFDYVIKPFDIKKVLGIAEKAVKACRDLQSTDSQYSSILNSEDYKEGIVGDSEPMQEVFKMIGQVATSEVTVMVTGESGTGKELVARCIYQHSLRNEKPFMAVNCAAIPDNLIESELFGHEKGSFTGASQQRTGKFELCDGGTLFLDEIGDMALPTQTKILRALQEGEIQRVGGEKSIRVDVRLIAATNKNLEEMVEKKTFREDLYYRLNVVRIRMPSLKERLSDVPALVDFMLQRLNKSRKTIVKRVSREALYYLSHYTWPGNVRELENTMQRCTVVSQGDTILTKDLPQEILEQVKLPADLPTESIDSEVAETLSEEDLTLAQSSPEDLISERQSALSSPDAIFDALYSHLKETEKENILQATEKELMKRALEENQGNQLKTSGILGMTRATLRKRIDQYKL